MKMSNAQWMSIGRDVLRYGGAYLTLKGYTDSGTVELVTGVVSAALGTALGVKSNSKKGVTRKAADAHSGA